MQDISSNQSVQASQQQQQSEDRQYERVLGECEFAPDLSKAQRDVIVHSVMDAMREIVDFDCLAGFDAHAYQWAQKRFNVPAEAKCFRIPNSIQDLARPDNPRRLQVEASLSSTDPQTVAKAQQNMALIEEVERVSSIGINLVDLGLLRGISAVRDAEGVLQIEVSWCLTVPAESCGQQENIARCLSEAISVRHAQLQTAEAWESQGATRPENLSRTPRAPRQIFFIDPDTQQEKSPYAASRDLDLSVLAEKTRILQRRLPNIGVEHVQRLFFDTFEASGNS